MNKLTSRLFSGLILAVVLGWAPSALAQLSLDRFAPSLPGDRFFGVEGADPGGHLLPRLMLLGDYAYRPLSLYDANNNRLGGLVNHQLVVHVAAGLSLWDRLVVAADMPLNLVTNGGTVDGIPGPSGAAAGDLRLSARVRLLGEARSPATLSLGGHLFVPTGNKDKGAGEGKVHGMPVLVFSGETSSLAYAATAGADLRSKTAADPTTTMGTQLYFGGAFGVLLADRMLQLGPEIYGATSMAGKDKFTKATTNLEGILGLKARLADFVLGAGAGPGFTKGVGTPALRALLSV
ncbi:MAG: porin, partial [Polyangia bacterium]